MSNQDKRQVFLILGFILVVVNTVSGAIAFLEDEDSRGALTFLVCFDVGLALLVGIYMLAHKLFPPSKDDEYNTIAPIKDATYPKVHRDITNDKD